MIMIDIEMPEKCGECPCFHAEHPMRCQLIKQPDKNKRLAAPYGLPRPDWCPLLNVENVEVGEVRMNPPYMCADCLCRVCARNECGDNYAEGVDNDCLGCNGCSGTVDLLEDCPKEAFVPDEETRAVKLE